MPAHPDRVRRNYQDAEIRAPRREREVIGSAPEQETPDGARRQGDDIQADEGHTRS